MISMSWILLALIAHFTNALVFIVDKSLLTGKSAVGSPLKYTFYSAILAAFSLVVLPFGYTSLTFFVFFGSLVAGLLHLLSLWFFFTALSSGEPSRVVPVVGSLVPLVTLLIGVFVLGETLSSVEIGASILLIIGGVILSVRLGSKVASSARQNLFMLGAGVCFALYFVVMKYVYDHTTTFLAVFVYSRVLEAVLAFILIGPFVLKKTAALKSKRQLRHTTSYATRSLFVGNKALAAAAFLMQHYAIKLGSVSIVNALQGTQYVFVLLLAALVSWRLPYLWQEEMRQVTLVQKIVGISFIVVALMVLV